VQTINEGIIETLGEFLLKIGEQEINKPAQLNNVPFNITKLAV